MNKDAYYFPHDSNAKDDPKCVLLIEQLGLEGYGIYWMLVEVLREQPDYTYPLSLLPALARRYNTTSEKVKAVVCGYELFTIKDDRIFFSDSLNRRMEALAEKRAKRSEAGRLGNIARWGLSHCDNNAIAMQSQNIASKVNKSKVEKRNSIKRKAVAFIPPSLSEVEEYIHANGYTSVNPQQFVDHYTTVGWRVGPNKMKDWQAAVRNWNSRNSASCSDTRISTPQQSQCYETSPKYQAL